MKNEVKNSSGVVNNSGRARDIKNAVSITNAPKKDWSAPIIAAIISGVLVALGSIIAAYI